MSTLNKEGEFKKEVSVVSQEGGNWFHWDDEFKYSPEVNKQEFPKFVEKVSEVRGEIIEAYPLLVLSSLRRKVRTEKLIQLLVDLSILDKNGKVIPGKLQSINDDDKAKIVGELKNMKLGDYSYLKEILKKWKSKLDDNELDLFNKCNVDVEKFKEDVEKWLEKLQEVKEIRDILFLNNMSVVIHVARLSKYNSFVSPYSLQDRISFGIKGLEYAIDNFSPDKGVSFATYARQPIVSWIDRGVFSNNIWKSEIGRLAKRYSNKQKELKLREGRLADEEEMARMLGVSVDDIAKARLFLERHQQEYRLDSPIGGDEEGTTHKDSLTVGNKDNPEYLTERKLSKELFWNVTEEIFGRDSRELAILKKRAEGKTLEDIAQEFNVTRERIRQIEKVTKNKLRNRLKSRGYRLDNFLS